MKSYSSFILGNLSEVFNGKTPSKTEQRANGYPVLKIKDVNELGFFHGSFESFVDMEVGQKYSVKSVRKGDTLILNAAHNANYVGSKIYYPEPATFGSLATGEWLIIRPNTLKLDSKYLNHWVRSPEARYTIRDMVKGIHLYPKDVARLEIPLPPLAEQKRIAAILDAADALRAKRRESLTQLDTLLQSTFLHMFGDPVTNPMGWSKSIIGDLMENIDSGWSPSCLDRSANEGEWGVLKLGAVTLCEYRDDQSKALPDNIKPRPEIEVQKGDLLFTRKNTYDLVAACALVHETRPKLMLPDLIFRLRFPQNGGSEPSFVWQQLINARLRKKVQSLASGAAGSMPNISKSKLRGVELIIPPLPLQHRFATIAESVEKHKARMRAHLAELDALFASLQARAFNGEL